jgi:hypothetical protein
MESDMVAGVPNYKYGNEGELFTSTLKGKYTERTLRGSLFHLNLSATTTSVAAGNITGAAAAASTQFALWNPVGSGKNLALLALWVGVISGTVPGGALFHNYANTVPTIGGSGGITNCLLNSSIASVAKDVASPGGITLTGGSALFPSRPTSLWFTAGAAANLAGSQSVEVIDGSIIIPPGILYVPCWSAAGTTLLNSYGLMWEEIPQ